MITLLTGLPGNGKTLYALQYVSEWAKREGREVWYHNIKGLKPELGWHQLPTQQENVNGKLVDVPQWWLCPAKSIVLIDEVQNCGFGVRPRGQVPEWAQKLETHRHLGLDLVFVTQSPTLLDSHDRALCELHFHVMRTFGMQRAVIHEFRPVRDNVLKSRKGSIEHHWKFPKHIFDWYTSAEAHTHKRRIPARVILLLALPFLIGGMSWFAWWRYLDPHRKIPSPSLEQKQPGQATPAVMAAPSAKLTPSQYVQQFAPRVAGLAYTAPAYDDVTKPAHAPYPAACVLMQDVCQCYTQQGTKLDVPTSMCEGIVKGGFFVAWQQKEFAQPQRVAQFENVSPAPTRPIVIGDSRALSTQDRIGVGEARGEAPGGIGGYPPRSLRPAVPRAP